MRVQHHPYELKTVDDTTWIIRDLDHVPRDPAHLVASLHHTDDDEIEVIWMRPTPLPVRYASPTSVLDDLIHWSRRPSGGSRRPVPIPHFPPTDPSRL